MNKSRYLFWIILLSIFFYCMMLSRSLATARKRPVEAVEIYPTPSVVPSPSASSPGQDGGEAGDLVTYDPASGVEKSFAQPAIDLMNQAFRSGCLRKKWVTHSFKSLKNVEHPVVKDREAAFERFIAGRPYALNLRWYSTLGKTVGYTFNWKDGAEWIGKDCYASAGCPSETKIYSNRRIVAGYSPKDRAAHWAHELSHQARAGGFVHWTFHQGSVPYETGDLVESCL